MCWKEAILVAAFESFELFKMADRGYLESQT